MNEKQIHTQCIIIIVSLVWCLYQQVISPASLEDRRNHTTAIVHRDSTHFKLVHYGGLDDNFKRLADTTVVDMGA